MACFLYRKILNDGREADAGSLGGEYSLLRVARIIV